MFVGLLIGRMAQDKMDLVVIFNQKCLMRMAHCQEDDEKPVKTPGPGSKESQKRDHSTICFNNLFFLQYIRNIR